MRDSILATPYAYPDEHFYLTPFRPWWLMVQKSVEKIPGDNWQEKLNYCVSCKCCDRHQINKPNKLVAWVETEISTYKTECDCECDCRHMARFICRQVDNPMPICPLANPITETEA